MSTGGAASTGCGSYSARSVSASIDRVGPSDVGRTFHHLASRSDLPTTTIVEPSDLLTQVCPISIAITSVASCLGTAERRCPNGRAVDVVDDVEASKPPRASSARCPRLAQRLERHNAWLWTFGDVLPSAAFSGLRRDRHFRCAHNTSTGHQGQAAIPRPSGPSNVVARGGAADLILRRRAALRDIRGAQSYIWT
jgi:hypothetical protein